MFLDEQMGKRFIRADVILFLLLLTILAAGRDFPPRTAEQEEDKEQSADTEAVEYGQHDSMGDVVGLAETGGENQSVVGNSALSVPAGIPEHACKGLETEFVILEAQNQVCQMDYTKITYYNGSYYYQSAADYFYLYKSDENGENQECLAQQVPGEIYVIGEWVYFTNVSAGGSVYRIRQDGSGMEEIFDRQVSRLVLMGESLYWLSEGNVYSWIEERGAELIYEGDCEWIFTRGRLIYLDIAETTERGETESYTVLADARGTVLAAYDGWHRHRIPWEGGFYYLKDGFLMCESANTGEVMEVAETPLSQYEHWTHYEIWGNCFYLLSYRHDDKNNCYHISMYRYDINSGNWNTIHSREISDKYLMLYVTDAFYIINGKIYLKEYVMDGKGKLWHWIDPETGEYVVFEDMEEIRVRALDLEEMLFPDITDATRSYRAEDGVYQGEKEDDEGNVIRTDIRIPQFNDKIPAYEKINQNIQEDAERFYQEQMEFAESIRDASEKGEGSSAGSWSYEYVYADSRYISIVYWKFIGRNVVTDVKCDQYEVRLYSAETGEEIEIWDLFTASKTEVLSRFAFAIGKTGFGAWFLGSDVNSISFSDSTNLGWYQNYFLLTDNGIDIFFVKRIRLHIYHFEVAYEEFEDILIR